MEQKREHRPHCGACGKGFHTSSEMITHLNDCLAVKTLQPYVDYLITTGSDGDRFHNLARMLQSTRNNVYLITRYAHSVVNERTPFMERSRLHGELCKKLGLDYESFRPFESETILHKPNYRQAEEILWAAIKEELQKVAGKQIRRAVGLPT